MALYKSIINVAFIAVLVGASCWYIGKLISNERPIPVPPIAKIQAISDLATLKIQLSDQFYGYNDYWEIVWLLHGEAVLGVDLSKAKYINVDESNQNLTLQLPPPHLVSSKVDHDRTVEIVAKLRYWMPGFGKNKLRAGAWQHADGHIAKLAKDGEYVEQTKAQAEIVISQLLHEINWKADFVWEDESKGVQP